MVTAMKPHLVDGTRKQQRVVLAACLNPVTGDDIAGTFGRSVD